MIHLNISNEKGEIASFIGHFFFFSAIAFLNNSYIFLESNIRFTIFAAMISLGSILIIYNSKEKRVVNIRYGYILLFLIFLSIIRINIVNSIEYTSPQTQIVQSIFTFLSILFSLTISNKFDIKLARNIMMVVFSINFIPIFVYRDFLFDYTLKENFRAGVLNYDAYQMISQLIGFMVICLISFVSDERRNKLQTSLIWVLILSGVYTLFLSPARGESVALLFAFGAYFISSGRWLVLLIIAIGAASFGTEILNSVLFERLANVAAGDFSERDFLFALALVQISTNIYTFLVGGGLNFYQQQNALPLELYPHNFLLEGFISGGLPLFISLIVVFCLPVLKVVPQVKMNPEKRFLMAAMIFLLVIYLKSGTLNSMWGMGAFTCLFVASSASSIIQSPKKLALPDD